MLIILGVIGSIIPGIPDVPLSFAGILLFKFSAICSYGWGIVAMWSLVAAIGILLNYYLPVLGVQVFGGSKKGIWGCMLGIFVGLFFFPPFGMLIGAFLGAFLFELIFSNNSFKKSLYSGVGSFLGYVVTTFLALILCTFMAYFFFSHFPWNHFLDWSPSQEIRFI